MIEGGGLGRGRARRRRPARRADRQRRHRRRRRRRGRGDRGRRSGCSATSRAPTPPGDGRRTRRALRDARARAPAPRLRRRADRRDARRRGLGHLPARALRPGDGRPRWRGSRAARSASSPTTRCTWPARSPSDAADKAARFMQLCDAFGLPIVSLVDTPGMMVGPEAEATGLVRHTSRLLVAGARAARAVRRGDPAPRLRPRRAGDGRRQPARAAAHRRAGRPPTSGRWASRAR